eukprot:835950-Prymnesium_polylepis.1
MISFCRYSDIHSVVRVRHGPVAGAGTRAGQQCGLCKAKRRYLRTLHRTLSRARRIAGATLAGACAATPAVCRLWPSDTKATNVEPNRELVD